MDLILRFGAYKTPQRSRDPAVTLGSQRVIRTYVLEWFNTVETVAPNVGTRLWFAP